jgi:hypothetical protein
VQQQDHKDRRAAISAQTSVANPSRAQQIRSWHVRDEAAVLGSHESADVPAYACRFAFVPIPEVAERKSRAIEVAALKTDPKKREVMVSLKLRRGFNVSLPVPPEPAGG